jgi:hypothetical protein
VSKAIDWVSPRPYVLYGALLIPSCFILVGISALFSTKGQVGLSFSLVHVVHINPPTVHTPT